MAAISGKHVRCLAGTRDSLGTHRTSPWSDEPARPGDRGKARAQEPGGAVTAGARKPADPGRDRQRAVPLLWRLGRRRSLRHAATEGDAVTGAAALLRATAPPRDPLTLAEEQARALGISVGAGV